MMLLLAQASTNTLLAAIVFTAVSLPVGIAVGYFWAYRFKRQYLRVARELANLRGENFRGELTTVGIPQRRGSQVDPPRAGRTELTEMDKRRWRAELAERTTERDGLAADLSACRQQTHQLQQRLDDAMAAQAAIAAEADEPTAPSGIEAWQLAQLHKEQIAMQLKLDDYMEQITQLTHQRDRWQARAESESEEFQQLRQLLAQQEAVIASVERDRDSLAARVAELECARGSCPDRSDPSSDARSEEGGSRDFTPRVTPIALRSEQFAGVPAHSIACCNRCRRSFVEAVARRRRWSRCPGTDPTPSRLRDNPP